MSEKNPILGYWTCGRGGRAEVTQTKKRGRHFNTRCDCCGFNQGTGAARQQAIWNEAEFSDGSTVVRPSNVREDGDKVASDPAAGTGSPAVEKCPAGDFDPDASTGTELAEAPPRFNKAGIIAGLVFVSAMGVGVWLN